MNDLSSVEGNYNVMLQFIQNQKNDVSYKDKVEKGEISLGIQGTRIVEIQSCNSLITKIINLFKGIQLTDLKIIEENKKKFKEINDRYHNDATFKAAFDKGEICLGFNGKRFTLVENNHLFSTTISNYFNGIVTNQAFIQKSVDETVSLYKLMRRANPSIKTESMYPFAKAISGIVATLVFQKVIVPMATEYLVNTSPVMYLTSFSVVNYIITSRPFNLFVTAPFQAKTGWRNEGVTHGKVIDGCVQAYNIYQIYYAYATE